MGSSHCRVCKRRLKNPLSIKLGIGPVCRAKDSLQKEFDFMRAQYEVLEHERGKYIFICDIGHNSGYSITNDAEYVVEQLYSLEEITDKTRIFCEDSAGIIDELLHSGKRHTGYKSGHEGVEL